MGCDIHCVFQKYDGKKWVDVESNYSEDRHYYLFGWIAGVRLREGVQPIALPRGLPNDFEIDDDYHNKEWMGEHSYSWLSADEILHAKIPDEGVAYFVNEVHRLAQTHGQVRLVFGFDS